MKLLQRVFFAASLLLLAGCYEVNEEIFINNDGTGTYASKMDMGQLLEMIQMFAGEDSMAKQGMDKVIDTTIMMASLADSGKDLTPPQRELMKNGKMHMQMNAKEKIFKINMDFKFKNYIQLHDLLSGVGNNSAGISQAFKGMFGGPEPDSNSLDAPRDPGLDQLKDVYEITVKDGLISKKVNAEKLKALMARPEMQQMQSMTGSGMEIMYTTILHLPRPAKKVDSEIAKLSDDKKTVTLKYNILDMFEHPEKFSFTIEY